ncbi:MAG TPA: translocation/assembly module TamB domain-containing protein [Gammaproteobacteria bacterium]|nr:translocation/assembly module TamB domain-containing protein [Gammaproteobacteria bacterium]
MKFRKLFVAGVILVLLLGMAGWLVGTTSGLRFVAARALPHLPVTLDPAGLDGRLLGPLSSGRIVLAAPGVSGSIERIEFDWRPSALLTGTLHVRDLAIMTPRIAIEARLPGDDEPAGEAPGALPLAIVLDRATLSDGALDYDGRTVVAGLQVTLAGRAAGDGGELLQLDLSSTQGELAGHARASLAQDAPWDVDLRWRMLPERGPVTGRTRITGTLADLAVDHEFTSPLEGRVAGTISGLPAAPAWQLEVGVEPLPEESGLWPEAIDGLTVALQLAGRPEDNSITGRIALPALAPGPIEIDLAGGWAEGVADIQRLDLALADGGRLGGTGRIVPADGPAASFELDGTGLGWPLGAAAPEVALPRLSLRCEGAAVRWRCAVSALARRDGLPDAEITAALEWADSVLTVERAELASPGSEFLVTASGAIDTRDERIDYRVAAEADMQLPDRPPVSAQLTAAGDLQGVRIETLEAQLLGGTVEGMGQIKWAGDDAADFRLAFSELDPAGLARGWPGRLSGVLEIRGNPSGEDGLEISLASLSGEFRSLPVSGGADLNVAGSTLRLHRAALAVGEATLTASGRMDEDNVLLDAALDAPALQALHDAARGGLAATAHIEGTRDAPRMSLEAQGAGLRWRNMRARSLEIDADIDLSGAQRSSVVASLERFATAPGPGMGVRVEADGTPEDHGMRLELSQTRPARRLELGASGSFADERWSGWVNTLLIEVEQQPVWALREPAALDAGAAGVSLGDACMAGTLGLLCLQAEWERAGPWSGRATLAQLDLAPLSQWLGAGFLAHGVLSGAVVVDADEGGFLALSGGLELTAGDIRLVGEDSNPLIAWDGGELMLTGDARQARGELQLALAGEDRVNGTLTVGWNAADPPLDGRLEAVLGQLQIITELVPDLADLEGHATVTASVSGTVGDPRLLGRFEWLDGTAQIPTLGLQPSDIEFVAQLEAGEFSFRGSGRSGEGRFETDGRFALDAEAVTGQAALRGSDVLLADLPEARVTATPDLQLTYAGRELVIGGTVSIPFARISGLGGPSAVTTSPDEVIVGPRAQAVEDEVVVRSRVRISVGPDVRVQAAGLRGRVEGSLLAVTQPLALPWGRGELRVVDGTFSTFGQRLEIETGRLIYTGGPLENPGLEIRAVRKVDEVTAGALVRGTLQQPEISVYSEPPLPRAEALSYLTLGKSLDQLQSGEQNTVNQAANSLAMSGGGLIARDLGRRLGLDDVSVSADDETGGTSVVIGKYLGAGLYVSYGLGLFDTVNTLRLRYQINQRLSVEATSGDEAAADLYYTFERD